MEEVIREGYWVCPNCEKKNKGSHLKCESCGSARGNVEFVYDEAGKEITGEKEKAEALHGPDWICAFCETSNPAGSTSCKQCSASPSEGKKRQEKDVPLNSSPKTKSEKPTSSPPPHPKPRVLPPSPQSSPSPLSKFIGLGIFLSIVLLIIWGVRTTQETMVVEACKWSRTISIQEYKSIQHEDWIEKVPAGGKILLKAQKEKSQKDVPDGYKNVEETYTVKQKVGTKKEKVGVKDLGNGKFKEIYEEKPVYKSEEKTRTVRKQVFKKVPVFDTWATFEVMEWVDIDKKVAEGGPNDPVWPETGISASSGAPTIGQKREGKRTENYEVTFKEAKSGKTYQLEKIGNNPLGSELFMKLRPKSNWIVSVTGFGVITEVKAP
ncbi:hypothetical protein HYY75_03070 [bacterium]|nr:hypothetical protein [bacterium]